MSFFMLPLLATTATAAKVPEYVNTYAPLVHLFSVENYNPASIPGHLTNTTPNLHSATVQPSSPSLSDLSALNYIPNSSSGKDIYLSSRSPFIVGPEQANYLKGVKPDASGKTEDAISAVIVTVEHASREYLDAYYFYFYAFDYGGSYPIVGNVGNHVGDWEHSMIRFNSTSHTPISLWYSQHSGGEAFSYSAVEKSSPPNANAADEGEKLRPIVYSANGTHANYATPGTHDHTIPGLNLPAGPVEDHTDAGALWDPTPSAYYFSFTPSSPGNYSDDTGKFSSYGDEPTDWLYFAGHWGDDRLPESDPRQNCDFGVDGLCQYQGGPTGPYFKDLNRDKVCPDSQENCNVLPVLLP